MIWIGGVRMAKRTDYYVYYCDGRPTRVAKIEDGCCAYGWENGRWVSMPGLIKIRFEITDYEEISREEAMRFIDTGRK